MQNAKVNREKEKDPEFRLKKFMKNAFHETSSSISDTASNSNRTTSNNKSTGIKNKLKGALPAWLLGDNGSES